MVLNFVDDDLGSEGLASSEAEENAHEKAGEKAEGKAKAKNAAGGFLHGTLRKASLLIQVQPSLHLPASRSF
jgi:hypothetical protein